MRLYNPNYGKETEKQLKARNRRQTATTVLVWLTILAAIAGLICCIVFKVKWYYYLVDIIGGIVLLIILDCIMPNEIKEYEDIPIEESEDEYVARELSKLTLTPEKVMTNVFQRPDDKSIIGGVAYKGIWHGIAVCECGHILSLKDITFDVIDRASITSHTENGAYYSEKGTVIIKRRCPKCGKISEGNYYVTLDKGSSTTKYSWLSGSTTTTSTSHDADYAGYVERIYNQDLALYKSDTEKYQKIIEQKTKELRQGFKYKRDADLRKIERLKENGWYEKSGKKVASDKIDEFDTVVDQIGEPKDN